MKRIILLLALSGLPSILFAQPSTQIKPLMSKELTGIANKEGTMLEVRYAPGASDPIHRHNAHAFIYVLEGTIVMQVRGGKETRLSAGQTFYEAPSDIHVVGKNASATEAARFLVFFVKDKEAPILIPAQ